MLKNVLIFSLIFPGFTKLLVAGGRSPTYRLRTVEVINLDPSSGGSEVCQKLPDLPKNLEGAIGHLFNGTTPVICGGYGPINATSKIQGGENPNGILCECFSLINGSWIYGSQVYISKLDCITRRHQNIVFVKGSTELSRSRSLLPYCKLEEKLCVC